MTVVYFQRRAREDADFPREAFELELPPRRPEEGETSLIMTLGPSLTMGIPMLLGSGMSLYFSGRGQGLFLLGSLITAGASLLLGALWAAGGILQAKKRRRRAEEKRSICYRSYLSACEERWERAYRQTTSMLHARYPSAEACALYNRHRRELWSRSGEEADFLWVRLGLGELPFRLIPDMPGLSYLDREDPLMLLPGRLVDQYRCLHEVPVGISLRECSRLSLIGGKDRRGAVCILRILLIQLASGHSHLDLRLALDLSGAPDHVRREIGQVRNLPHLWNETETFRFFAASEEEAGSLYGRLQEIFQRRNALESGTESPCPLPHYVLIVYDEEAVRNHLFWTYAKRGRGDLGLTVLSLAERREDMSEGCDAYLQRDDYACLIGVRKEEGFEKTAVKFDDAGAASLGSLTRNLAGLRMEDPMGAGGLPDRISLLEAYACSEPGELELGDRWRRNRSGDGLHACVGMRGGGRPCILDLHERGQGPHALVAGTTGAGKSELLLSMLLSLALEYSPGELVFFLIDYKGGGLSDQLKALPHLVGSVTNLSGLQSERALLALRSEVERRQKDLALCQVNARDRYAELEKGLMPHLLIVVDEFAELRKEMPDFIEELISISRVGRSLGLHLVLATQKPSGAVDERIWSNARLRICLKVQEVQESMDMLGHKDAAFLEGAGRAWMQVGNDECYEQFQSAYTGHPVGGERRDPGIYLLDGRGQAFRLEESLPDPEICGGEEEALPPPSEKDVLVEQIRAVFSEGGYDLPRPLWQEALSDRCMLPADQESSGIILGLLDDPAKQRRFWCQRRPEELGNTIIYGKRQSGKSSLLHLICLQLLKKYSRETGLYIIEGSGRGMEAWSRYRQVGAAVGAGDRSSVRRLLTLLRDLPAGARRFYLVLDDIGAFREKTGHLFDEEVISLLREGPRYGLTLLISAGGRGENELPYRMEEYFQTRICLETAEEDQQAELAGGGRQKRRAERGIPGRGLILEEGRLLEIQTALPDRKDREEPDGEEDLPAVREGDWSVPGLTCLPEKISRSAFMMRSDVQGMRERGGELPLGLCCEEVRALAFPLEEHAMWLLLSDRSRKVREEIRSLMKTALWCGFRVTALDFGGARFGELQMTDRGRGDYVCVSSAEDFSDWLSGFWEEVDLRRGLLGVLEANEGEVPYGDICRSRGRLLIFIPDIRSFLESEMSGKYPSLLSSLRREDLEELGICLFIGLLEGDGDELMLYPDWKVVRGIRQGLYLGSDPLSQRFFPAYSGGECYGRESVGLAFGCGCPGGRTVLLPGR